MGENRIVYTLLYTILPKLDAKIVDRSLKSWRFVSRSSQLLGCRVSWADQHQQSGRFKAAEKGNEDGDEKRGNTTGGEKGEKRETTKRKAQRGKKGSGSALPQFPMKLISVPPKDPSLPSPPSRSPRAHYTPVPLDE